MQHIAESTGGRFLSHGPIVEIDHISIDSRVNEYGAYDLFIAFRGQNHNGHDFIPELIKKGVKNFIVEEDVEAVENINIIKVTTSVKALQTLATVKRKRFISPVIGITGSNGKTIIKEWLYDILSTRFSVLKSPKSYNSQIGVPLSVWPIGPEFNMGIFEAGISQPGEMEKLASIISPTIGIFTNIGTAHEEFFDSQNQKVSEKLKLFKDSEALVFCMDHELIARQINESFIGEKIGWSFNGKGVYNVELKEGHHLAIRKGTEQYTFSVNLKDKASLENIVHCIITSLVLGVKTQDIQEGIDRIQPIKMRLELKKGINRSYLIDDTYNNDVAGLHKALDFMDQQKHVSNKTIILSDFIQNKHSKTFYTELNQLLLQKNVNRLIGIGPQLSQHKQVFDLPATFYTNTESFLQSDEIHQFQNELVLIKGARQFALEKVSKLLAEKGHKTVLEVNLDAITHNLNFYRSLLKPDTKIMVVVKALAYGSGSEEVSKMLEFHKVDYLAVAYADEGVALRKNGVTLPIMVMNASDDDPFNLMRFNLEPEIFSLEQLKSFTEAYALADRELQAHLILNTGMNRLGFNPEDLDQLIDYITSNKSIKVKSVFTHLAASEELEHSDFTKDQVDKFRSGAQKIEDALAYKPIRHILNSGGIVRHNSFQEDMVRLGIGLHGIEVSHLKDGDLQNTAYLKTVISQIRYVKSGETIGYGRSGVAKKDMKIATIAIGYADGYLRVFGNGNAFVVIQGQKAKTVGNICMDMSMVDVTGLNANVGDEVVVFGENPSVSQLADWAGTIPYEILTNVSNRVKRVFYTE
ncbi:hypothetical protein BFP71_00220 [Roseivirga misakiensis]|uniref:Alanine racemase n=1 Tax=Roseivirga misakiensis TaxID=1563681 RepID=A0A1E5T812_9BACT|nr:hypothetical protein BFP71_00220 [Roseivirga misakiensis]